MKNTEAWFVAIAKSKWNIFNKMTVKEKIAAAIHY